MNVEDPKKPLAEQEEEVAYLDDRVVGRAFQWSTVAIVLLAGAAVATVMYLKRTKPKAAPKVTQLTAPAAAPVKAAEIPTVKFTDVTAAAGLRFVHHNGAYGDKLLPETMGAGAAFFDFDNDGAQDVLFVNSTYWPWDNNAAKPKATMVLYRNDGSGKFADATDGSGLDVSFYGMGAAAGDIDNDGNTDVFITGVGDNRLFRNLGGGKFADVTEAAGVKAEPGQWSTTACFFDYDNDGRLDLFVGNYVKWSRAIDAEVGYKIDGKTRAYAQPMNFQGAFPRLFHNDGGKFTDVSAQAGVQVKSAALGVPAAKSLGVAPADLDGDGFMDLVVANDTTPNFVFHNQKNGTFKECGATCGVAFDSYGNTRGAMGIDVAHYRNDAALGITIGNFANEMTALYVSQPGALFFTDEAIPEGIGPASRLLLKFGIFFFDYDLDGRLDVLSANGHLDEEIVKIQKSQSYRQPTQLFWNTGAKSGATFVSVDEPHAGKDLFKPIVGRGSAYADIDGDGDLDVLLTQAGGAPLLLRNDQSLGHHWLGVKLVGSKSNRSAIGAKLVAKVGGQTLLREVNPARSYLSASALPITFGLGRATKVDSLEITWPSGQEQTVTPEKIDTAITIEEPR